MATNFLGALDWHVGAGDDLGARHHGKRGGGKHQMTIHRSAAENRHMAAQQRANRAASFAMPDVPGVPSRDAALVPAAFPFTSFVAATGINIVNQTMQPQMPFRGQRLTAFVIRNGTSAGTTAPMITYFQIGMKPIITTVNPVALETFNQNAFDTNLLMPPTTPGVIYQIGLQLPVAVTGSDSLLAFISIIGTGVL